MSAAPQQSGGFRVGRASLNLVRVLGVGVIVCLVAQGRWEQEMCTRLLALSGLTCAWLLATGTFGFGQLSADDWPAAVILALALGIRLLLVRPGNSEILVYFPYATFAGGWLGDKHSVLYDAWKAVFLTLVGPSHAAFIVVNSVVGALTVVPLYLFVRNRFGDLLAAALAALFFSIHPLIARYAATDAHFSFILFFLFCGLAFLAEVRGWREIFAGFVCLGIAGALRIEGAAYVGVSLLLIDWRGISRAVHAHPKARSATVVAIALALTLTAGNLMSRRFSWGAELSQQASVAGGLSELLSGWDRGPLFDVAHAGDGFFLACFWLGVVAAIARRRFHGVLWVAAAAALLSRFVLHPDRLIWPSIAHRFNVVWALQAVVAAVGAAWVLELLPRPAPRQAAAVAFAVAAVAALPLRHLDELRHEHEFNTEYELVKRHVQPRSAAGPCRLLYFNDGDMGLNNPGVIVPGVRPRELRRAGLSAARRGGRLPLPAQGNRL